MGKIKVFVPIRHPVGGIRTYLKYTIKNLQKEEYYFSIFGPKINTFEQLSQDLKYSNVNFVYFNKNDGLYTIYLKIRRILNNEKFDIIHSQGYTAGILTIFANFMVKIPHIMTSHDVFREDQFHSYYGVIKKILLGYLFRMINIIQSVSYDAQENLLEYLPSLKKDKNKLIVINNGVEIEEFNCFNNSKEYRTIDRQDKDVIIGFIGRYTKQKGFLYIVETAELLKKKYNFSSFKIICVAWMNLNSREYQNKINNLGLNEYFSFLGFLPNVNQILQQIDVLIIPSLWEACPILPMEALVSKTPIIAFSCIGLREVLENTPAKLVSIGDVNKIAEEIIYLSENKERVRQKYSEYRKIAIERFDAKKTARNLQNVYKRVLDGYYLK